MTDPTLIYCVGATKAGTSWLYRHLHDHPEAHVPAVKEAHYWDTFNTGAQVKQVEAYRNRLVELKALLADAKTNGRGWQVRNVTRRISDMESLLQVLQADRAGHVAYLDWLMGDRTSRIAADMTPNYATLPVGRLQQMAATAATSKFVYLIRDPIDRLWSHVRMQARRFRQDHEVYEKKANNILWRVVNAGAETHLTQRGDYPATIKKLEQVVPRGRLFVQFAEKLFTPDGLRKMSDFLGISFVPSRQEAVHMGEPVRMREELRPKVAAFLKEQYDWVAQHMGPLPQNWQDNYARAMA